MAKVVTMGEIMLRLSTPGNEKFIQADEFDVCYGGGEANVAVSLANYGHDAQFVTKVPKNPIGECALAALRKMNVGTKHIAVGGTPGGFLLFKPARMPGKPSCIILPLFYALVNHAGMELPTATHVTLLFFVI